MILWKLLKLSTKYRGNIQKDNGGMIKIIPRITGKLAFWVLSKIYQQLVFIYLMARQLTQKHKAQTYCKTYYTILSSLNLSYYETQVKEYHSRNDSKVSYTSFNPI